MPNFSGLFTRNLTLKVSAFAVALLLWFSVQWESPGRHQFQEVPVRVDLSDPSWVLMGAPQPAVVSVSLQGASGDLSRTGRPSVVIPMDEVTNGDTTVVLQSQWVRVQDRPGVGIENIQPASVRLTFEPVERLTVPLAFELTGLLREGLALTGSPLPSIQEVRVSGPRSRLAELDSVYFEPVDLTEIASTGTVTLAVDTTATQGLQVQPPSIQVEIQVEDEVERMVAGVPVVLSDPDLADEFESIPEFRSVQLVGARTLVGRVDATRLQVVIEVDEDALPDPGEDRIFDVRIRGVPDWVVARVEDEDIVLRRVPEES